MYINKTQLKTPVGNTQIIKQPFYNENVPANMTNVNHISLTSQ